jgi:tetratricopeptide (TPR) repeat protein
VKSGARAKTRARFAQAWSLGLLASCVACAEGSGGVTRMADGVRYEGRFVNPEAYAAYAVGVDQEARGDYAKAVSWYLQARAEDPESPEIWARIGAAQCFGATPPRGLDAASRAFGNGIRLDPRYYGNYFERARCAERARNFDAGLKDATAAVERRPGDEPANLLVARLMQAQGRSADARLWLEAFHSYREASPAMNRALESARAPAGAANGVDEGAALQVMPANSVAFAELRAGKVEVARQHAEIELGADPTNSDAWIAMLVACDALRDNVCFDSTLESLKTPSLAPSRTGLVFLSELLSRRTGARVLR